MLQRIKSADDSHELLELMVGTKKLELEPHQLSQALGRLFTLQKTGGNTINPSQLAKHPGFDNMCRLLKFKAPRMEANDLVISLKAVTYFGMPSDSLIVNRLLHHLKDEINSLSLNNLIFLGFLLTKMKRTPLIEALQIAIPIVFNLNVNMKLDHNNTVELTELLKFVSNSSMRVSGKSMTNIITALTLHGQSLELPQAQSIVWSLASMRRFDAMYERLFLNCMSVLNSKIMEMGFEDLESTLERMIARLHVGEFIFFNDEYFSNCAKFVVANDLGFLNASFILRKFNKVGYVSIDLLNYVDRQIVKNPSNLSSSGPAGLITFGTAFSNANYRSENWEIVKSILHENPLLHGERLDLPWIKFAVEMMSLGFHSNLIFEKVFSTRFLEQALSRDNSFLDHIQLLLLWQSVKLLIPDYDGPLPENRFIDHAVLLNFNKTNEGLLTALSDVFSGREFIQTNVASSHGHCLDYVISFDNQENVIAMPCRIKTFDELPKSQVKSVAVFFQGRNCFPLNYPEKLRGMFDLKRRTIEKLNIKQVGISTQLWNNMPENEKHKFLEREIRYSLR